MRRPSAFLAALASLALAACGGGGGAPPLDLPPAQWTWVDVPGTRCSDGSPTGIAVNPAPAGSTDSIVLVFLDGGGACWGSSLPWSCGWGTATAGPYGAVEFQADTVDLPGSILDRTVPGTPFAGATLVFVPYCTGDVHWGESAPTYAGYPADGGVWHHAGKANLAADLAWLAGHVAQPGKLVVAGSSAGGYGSLLAFDLARAAWPDAVGYLIDDSGPPLVGSDVPASELAAWYEAWNLDATLGPLCGTGCRTDLSQVVAALPAHPADRIALLSNLQDSVVSYFLEGKTGSEYQAALLRLVDQRFATATPDAHAFLVPGTGHVLLGDVAAQSASGVSLPDWLREMVQDDPGWTTLGHP